MEETKTSNVPADWLAGLKQNWRSDFIASISVAFVALPLALGVAYASGAPLISGVISSLVSGFICTFIRGSHISVNGAAAGLAVVVAGSIYSLRDNSDHFSGFDYALAAFIVAGLLQVVIGLLRFGKYSDFFPASVIQGMLAAIGIIIAGKQFHVALGVKVGDEDDKLSPFQEVLEIGDSIWVAFPYPAIIAVLSILILILHPRIKNKLVSFIPAAMWVLMITIPMVYLYQYYQDAKRIEFNSIKKERFEQDEALLRDTTISDTLFLDSINNDTLFLLDKTIVKSNFKVPDSIDIEPVNAMIDSFRSFQYSELDKLLKTGDVFLIDIPGDIGDHVLKYRPNFSKINRPEFWLWVFTIMLVSSIITVLSAKAIDKLDPYKRKTNMNRELIGMGLSCVVAGFLGGLPVVTVIVRSSVNVNNGGKTRWSNFFHGLIILILMVVLTPLIKNIPLAALAAILVYTGYKLASPKIFVDTYRKGAEQFIIMAGTLFLCLLWGILLGVILGIVVTLLLQYSRMNVTIPLFRKYIMKPGIGVIKEDDNVHLVKVKGISNFVNILGLMSKVEKLPQKEHVIIDFSQTRLIDFTVLEYIHKKAESYNLDGGQFDIVGLEVHHPSSDHPYSMHVLETERKERLTKRQQELRQLAESNNWHFNPKISWNILEIKGFQFFQSKPIEYKKNVIKGTYPDMDMRWEICDLTFDEGALLATEVYHTTIQVVKLPYKIPKFTLEKEEFFDRLIDLANPKDIDFKKFKDFSDKFLLKGKDARAIKDFFTYELTDYLNKKEVYHLESKGSAIMIFKFKRYAGPRDVIDMNIFTENLMREIDSIMKSKKV